MAWWQICIVMVVATLCICFLLGAWKDDGSTSDHSTDHYPFGPGKREP